MIFINIKIYKQQNKRIIQRVNLNSKDSVGNQFLKKIVNNCYSLLIKI